MKLELVQSWQLFSAEAPPPAVLAPSGEWLALAEHNEVLLQQALTRKEIARLRAGIAPITCLAVAPDSSWLLAGSDAEDEWFTLRVYARQEHGWGLASEFEAHQRTSAVAIADGNTFASGGDGVLTLWSLEGGDLWSSEAGAPITALAFSDDGAQLAVARTGSVEAWSRDGAPLWRVEAPECTVVAYLGDRVVASGVHGLCRFHEGILEESVPEPYLAEQPVARCQAGVWFGPGVSLAGHFCLYARHGLELWRGTERMWRVAPVEEMLVAGDRLLLSGSLGLTVRTLEGRELARHVSEGGLGKLSVSQTGELAGWVTNSELVVLDLASGHAVGRAPARNFASVVDRRLVFGKLLVYPTWTLQSDGSLEGRTDLVAPKLVLEGDSALLAVPEGGLRRARFDDGVTEQTYYATFMPDRQAVRGEFLVAWTQTLIGRWNLLTGAALDLTPCVSSGLAISPAGARALALHDGLARLVALGEGVQLAALPCENAAAVAALDEEDFLLATADGHLHRYHLSPIS